MTLGLSTGYLSLLHARLDGTYQRTEGCVQGFHPMGREGHQLERVQVNGQEFDYSDFVLTSGFRQTEAYGGPIHADSRVRLGYVGSDIVRVEVVDHACPRAPDPGRSPTG
jgi:hypothetical protein